MLLLEYFRKPEVTVKVHRNCWFHTGDACRQIAEAPDTYAFIDRMGGFFRVRGENVSSFEVEALVALHPGVRAVAAVPMPAQVGDEDDIAVFIEAMTGVLLDEAAIRLHASTAMPRFMQPLYIRFVDALPVTATNKIEKYKLKQQLLQELAITPA